MIKETQLSKDIFTENGKTRNYFDPMVKRCALEGIDEVQQMYIAPWSAIKMHEHVNQWEVWVNISHKKAYVCLKGEKHKLVNNTGTMITLLSIKGHTNYSYEDIAELFERWNFSTSHSSLVVMD